MPAPHFRAAVPKQIREGVVADQAEIARLGFVSRARVKQIMNLLNLAPEIQVALLKLPIVDAGRDEVTERELRLLVELPDWQLQSRAWNLNCRVGGSAYSEF